MVGEVLRSILKSDDERKDNISVHSMEKNELWSSRAKGVGTQLEELVRLVLLFQATCAAY